MNIFVLDDDPRKAARMLNNKHVIKMSLESVQILCSIHEPGTVPYRRTHYNHPCVKWAREYKDNYLWLMEHTEELFLEYTRRYKKVHKSSFVFSSLPKLHLPKGFSDFALAMPEQYILDDTVSSYRNYYLNEKLKISKWMNEEQIPEFVKEFILINRQDIKEFLR